MQSMALWFESQEEPTRELSWVTKASKVDLGVVWLGSV